MKQLIARLDGRDVGAAAMFTRRRIAWLGAGTVLPEARGRGIQRALIAQRARAADELGCRRIIATADLGGGFGREPDGHGHTAHLVAKPLPVRPCGRLTRRSE
jgi:GNAT superfamily N-acetyltransferase